MWCVLFSLVSIKSFLICRKTIAYLKNRSWLELDVVMWKRIMEKFNVTMKVSISAYGGYSNDVIFI